MKQRVLSLILSLAVVLTLIPAFSTTAYADPTVISVDYLYPIYNTDGVITSGIKEWATGTTDAAIVTSSTTTWNAGWYVVTGAAVSMTTGVTVNGSVNLILADGCSLSIQGENYKAGIDTISGSITVYGQTAGTGSLIVNGGKKGSGIGGHEDSLGNNIVINGGTIYATGGEAAAGIGGGKNGTGKYITINGGTINATGGENAAGIGGGQDGIGEDITINGGTINATGGENAAGIGGGMNNRGEKLIINGGCITATGGRKGAGIGGGDLGHGKYITINGGTINATGGLNAAGIGGGYDAYGAEITINGGYITAIGINAAGIGSWGAVESARNITIASGLMVKADNITPPSIVITSGGISSTFNVFGSSAKRYVSIVPADTSWYNTSDTEFILSDVADLEGLAAIVNGYANGISADTFKNKTIKLSDDFCDTTALTTTIGDTIDGFKGTFDGNGKVVNLSININSSSSETYAGLIGYLKDGIVKNVGTKGEIKAICNRDEGYCYVGGIVGNNEGGTIVNCFSLANVYASANDGMYSYAGGIAGRNGNINNCYATGTFSATGSEVNRAGAVSGSHNTSINVSYCYSKNTPIAGIGDLTNCHQIDGEKKVNNIPLVDALNNYVSSNSTKGYKTWEIRAGENDGYPVFALHAHNWTYKDNSDDSSIATNTLVATCSSIDCPATDLELVVSVASVTFDGSTHGAILLTSTGAIATSFCGNAASLPAISYQKKNGDSWDTATTTVPSNAGIYKASITVGTSPNEKTAYALYTISKAAISPSVSIAGWTYNETENTPGVSGNPGNGNISYLYKAKNSEDSTYSSTVPSNAGIYTIKATISETINYEGSVTTTNFAIAKANQTISAPSEKSKTAVSVTLTTQSGIGETKYGYNTTNTSPSSWQDGEIITGLSKNTSYYFFVKFTGNDNYNEIVSSGTQITTNDHVHEWVYTASGASIIATCANTDGGHGSPLASELTLVKPLHDTYNDGKAANATTTGGIDGVACPEIKYLSGSAVLNEAPTKAGIYKASITLGADSNATTASIEYEISKAAINPAVSIANWTYGGLSNTPSVTGNTESGNVTYSYKLKGAADSTYIAATPTDAGVYIVKAEIASTENYKEASVTTEFAISPKKLSVSGTTVADKEYDGTTSAQATVGTVSGIVGTDDVKVLINTASFASVTVGSDKSVDITYKLSGSAVANYSAPDDETKTASISAKKIVVPASEAGLKYNAASQNGVILPAGAVYTLTDNTATNAGVFQAKAVLNDKINYVWDLATPTNIDQTIDWTISKRVVVITSASVSKQYDGTPLTSSAVEVGGDGFAAGEGAEYNFTGSQSAIGFSANTFTYQLASNTDLNNYDITVTYGTLIVTAQPVYDNPAPVVTVPVSGDKDTIKVQATISGNNATVKNVTSEEITKVGTNGNVVMDLSSLSDDISGVTIPKSTFENVANSDAKGLKIVMPNGTIAVFDKTLLAAVASQAKGSDIKLVIDRYSKAEKSMTKAQKETVSQMNNPAVLDAYFVSNGQRITDFKGGEAVIIAEYPTEHPVRVWYVADDGNKELVPSTYDGKVAKFTVTHFSHYVVEQLDGSNFKTCPQDGTCVYATFTDTDTKAWYHDGVHFCVENKYMSGYWENLFGPGDTLSRAMIVRILYNLEGQPKVSGSSSFTDVLENEWYSDAIAWAEENKVVDGYGEGLFGPKNPVTREQLAAIYNRYSKYKGFDVSQSAELTAFTDANLVSDWALNNIKWAVAVKLMEGKGGGILDPTGYATRAEAATMLKNYCENIAK